MSTPCEPAAEKQQIKGRCHVSVQEMATALDCSDRAAAGRRERSSIGTTFRIHLKASDGRRPANIYTVVYDNATSGYACAFNSQGDVEIIIQATGAPGWHFIDLYPAIYKGSERRPNNYRTAVDCCR